MRITPSYTCEYIIFKISHLSSSVVNSFVKLERLNFLAFSLLNKMDIILASIQLLLSHYRILSDCLIFCICSY